MQIRAANLDDVEQVLPLVDRIIRLHESWDETWFGMKPDVLESYRAWMTTRATDPESVFIVAEQENRLVAFLVGTMDRNIPIYRVDKFGFIHDVWVEPDYRNEGLGRSMTMLALEHFKQLGATQVRLDTAIQNDAGRALFERCGFRPTLVAMACEL